MPKVNYCPKCGKQMKRLYQKSEPNSRVVAMGWKCSTHIWVQGFEPKIGSILMLYESVPFSMVIDKWRQEE
jgi:hypothetical protein